MEITHGQLFCSCRCSFRHFFCAKMIQIRVSTAILSLPTLTMRAESRTGSSPFPDADGQSSRSGWRCIGSQKDGELLC